jgi:hypothetical protein
MWLKVPVPPMGHAGAHPARHRGERLLDERGVTVHVAATPDAVDLYNRLTGTDAVGGLFHSTC